MPGVKGKSGRKSKADESFRLMVIEKAWRLLNDKLDSPEIDIKTKLDIASKIAVKSMPTQFTGELPVAVKEMPAIQKEYTGEADGKPVNRVAEFDIGSPDPTEIT